jgi:hypothetical protein
VIKVKRHKDGKVFTSGMSQNEGIYEMHFCTSYTQVMIYETDEEGNIQEAEVICEPIGTECSFVDSIAIQDDDTGEFV